MNYNKLASRIANKIAESTVSYLYGRGWSSKFLIMDFE